MSPETEEKSKPGRKKSDNKMDNSITIKVHPSINDTLDFHVLLFNAYFKEHNKDPKKKITFTKSLLIRALVSKYLREFPIPDPSVLESDLEKNTKDIKNIILTLESALKKEKGEERELKTEEERSKYRKGKVDSYNNREAIDKLEKQAQNSIVRYRKIQDSLFYRQADEKTEQALRVCGEYATKLRELIRRLRKGEPLEVGNNEFNKLITSLDTLLDKIESSSEE